MKTSWFFRTAPEKHIFKMGKCDKKSDHVISVVYETKTTEILPPTTLIESFQLVLFDSSNVVYFL